ncbi:hypothetical protein ACNQ16_01290 [Mycoplasma sp. 3137]|uniref:hypothetical protein n=1 Tax=Mycoplasma sp. 3137 TaxID=3401687 RepID=UPI003AACDA8E
MNNIEEKVLKRRDEFIKGLENQIEWIKQDEYFDMNVIYLRLNSFIQNNIRKENRLLNYGVAELNNSIDLIERGVLDETITSVEEMAFVSFSRSMEDGSLTFSDKLAKLELDAEFDNFQEINELLYKSHLDIDKFDNELIHIAAVEQKLANALKEKFCSMYVGKFANNSSIDNKLLLLLCAYELMQDNGYDYKEKVSQIRKILKIY